MKQLLIILVISYPFYLCVSNATKQNATNIGRNNNISPFTMIEEGQSLLKEGDLVVRLNRDPSSRFIKHFNRHDQSYSHSGIVLFENGYPFVFHIVNGEENPDEKLRKDSLCQFCNPRKNIAYGIFRYELTTVEIKRLKDIIHKLYVKGVRFDRAFNLVSDDKMYCSEMVSKALTEATSKRILIEPTRLTTVEATFFSAYTHLPFSYTNNLRIISIDALYINPFCHSIKEYNFEK